MKKSYSLPNGLLTKNSKEYVASWEKLANPIVKATGATLFAFDPSLTFSFRGFVFDLPACFVKALSGALREVKRG